MTSVYQYPLRPGYFGKRRDVIIQRYNDTYGVGNWDLVWVADGHPDQLFLDACVSFYERSYFDYLDTHPELVDEICSYGECIDNALTNIDSGLDYSKQESYATHIQDIAIRNVLHLLDRKFEGPMDRILVIRSKDSNGYKFGPGNVPFFAPELINQPSKAPGWATAGSVEDFWQSNKWLRVKADAPQILQAEKPTPDSNLSNPSAEGE